MVMAASTVGSESQKCLAHGTDKIFQFILSHRHSHLVVSGQGGVVGSGDQKTGGSNCVDVVRIKDISG